ARYFAVMRGDPASEEVFTTALLYHLGEMIFWSFAGKEIDSLRQELKRKDIPRTEAEKNVLGFELNELTAALGRKWGLGRLLEDSVSAEQMDNPRLKTVRLSHQLVKLVEQGWETEETKNLLQEIVAFTGLPQTALMPALRRNTEEAVQLAEAYGASAASERIARLVETPADDEDLKELERQLARTENAEQPPVRDAEYQLKVLRKLSDTIIAGSSVSEVLELVLDGIYRGIGMDRALFALLSPNKKYLRAKSVAGAGRDILARKFKLEVNEAAPTIFDKVICEQDAFWIKDRSSSAAKELIPQLLEEIIGDGPFFVAPAVVDNQAIGIFFADRRPSMRELDEECFDAFRQFAMQANLALEYLGKY
ncbi:MAG TPA: HDOD domain-containing protein, partial [Oligoflexia bacterium]|nr:HDOD domain-containing protein [Oligoflexia bacterium]